MKKIKEKPSPEGPLGWIMTLHNSGELTVHAGSRICYLIEKAFNVKFEKTRFVEQKQDSISE